MPTSKNLTSLRRLSLLFLAAVLFITNTIVFTNCISSRAGNYPSDVVNPPKQLPQKISLDYEIIAESSLYEDKNVGKSYTDLVAKEFSQRFEDTLKQNGNFDRITNGAGKELYHIKATKEMTHLNTGWATFTFIISGFGLILPRFAGTTEVNMTFEVFKKDKLVKKYNYPGAKMHDFGWTLFLFAMPFTRTSKTYAELEIFTVKKFLAESEADQVFSK